MAYPLDIDPAMRAQIQALPPAGVDALAEAMTVLSLVPERGEPINAANPDGGVYQFGLRRRPRADHYHYSRTFTLSDYCSRAEWPRCGRCGKFIVPTTAIRLQMTLGGTLRTAIRLRMAADVAMCSGRREEQPSHDVEVRL